MSTKQADKASLIQGLDTVNDTLLLPSKSEKYHIECLEWGG